MSATDNQARKIQALLDLAGVKLNGSNPWDPQIHRPDFYAKVLGKWSLGLGESYMDGDWDCEQLDEFFTRILRVQLDQDAPGLLKVQLLLETLRHRLFNLQSRHRAFQVGKRHYDVGNDLFEAMLDPYMMYSCGYWAQAQTLSQAQQDKLDLICRKLELQAGESLLDIGCGWGGLARFAAEHYRVSVVGVTVSKEQQYLAQVRCTGLPVEILLCDYRDLLGHYDKIVSVGMFEHVGSKNYATFFAGVTRLLKAQGLFLLHTIGSAMTVNKTDEWIDRYIFPNGHLPSLKEIGMTLAPDFQLEDWHNFGHDYDRTLMAWHARFEAAWPDLSARYDLRFYRKWRYYLLCSAGLFRSGEGRLWQLVLARRERQREYRSIR
ncbi:MAG: cyclopropane fatty acyl phospholipid synthase [Ferrovum sp.]|nr:cyclopropane fatty acyl phospholipid synthase [Ferrovum sp.]